jgi:hypothetical protein
LHNCQDGGGVNDKDVFYVWGADANNPIRGPHHPRVEPAASAVRGQSHALRPRAVGSRHQRRAERAIRRQLEGLRGSAVDNIGVTTLIPVGATGDGVLHYGRWQVVRAGYVASTAGAGLLLAVVMAIGLLRRNRVRRSVRRLGS